MKLHLTPIAFAVAFIFQISQAFSISYFVSPTGSGEECSEESPCSLVTGLAKPQAGDEVVLLDGVYSESLLIRQGGTPDQPVTVRAANKWGAVVRVPDGVLGRVWASYVTVNGIAFDGAQTGGNKGAVRVGAGDEVVLPEPVHDVVLEYLHIKEVGAAGISITSGEHDVIIRHCQIEGTGYREFWGEGFYLGNKTDPAKTVYNIDIYLNNVQGFTENGLETKKHSHHVKVHDNFFQSQVPWSVYGGDPTAGNDGTITLDGHSHEAYSNKLFNNECGMAAFVVEPEAGHRVYNNLVFDGVGRGEFAVRMKDWSKTWAPGQYPPSQVYNNTFYRLPSHAVGTVDPSVMVVKNNIGLDLEANLPASEVVPELFQDAANADFRLATESKAIDQAHSEPYSLTDYDAHGINGACRDLWAFEFDPPAQVPDAQVVKPAKKRPPSAPTGLKAAEVKSGD